MSFQPTLNISPHQEFHFAENTDSKGCCCYWKSKAAKPHTEYMVDKKGIFHPKVKVSVKDRIVANQRLANLLVRKFEKDAIDNEKAFQMLKEKINDTMEDDPITDERLVKIVSEIHHLKERVKKGKRKI